MTEKRFKFDTALDKIYDCDTYNNETHTCESYDNLYDVADLLNSLSKENEQLKQQLNIFEKFLEGNDLDIEWNEFCGVDKCAFENPDFSCKECIHLKGDVE